MNGSFFSKTRYNVYDCGRLKKLARTPVPKLTSSYLPPPPPPSLRSSYCERAANALARLRRRTHRNTFKTVLIGMRGFRPTRKIYQLLLTRTTDFSKLKQVPFLSFTAGCIFVSIAPDRIHLSDYLCQQQQLHTTYNLEYTAPSEKNPDHWKQKKIRANTSLFHYLLYLL